MQKDGSLIPIEIKSSETYQPYFFDSLAQWNAISETTANNNYLVYGGSLNIKTKEGHVLPWASAGTLIDTVM